MISRRSLIKTAAISSVTLGLAGVASLSNKLQADPPPGAPKEPEIKGPFTLPPLPYAYSALEPAIDEKTMMIHHDKHHGAYVKNANKALADFPELAKKSPEFLVAHLDDIPEAIRMIIRNNVGGHLNHTWFWTWMTPNASQMPEGPLAKAIDAEFGSFASFKDKFSERAIKVFGSGWVWLTISPDKKLAITSTPNQDNPLMTGPDRPILGLDVWEHAYYLKHQNVRADYIKDFFTVINWEQVGKLYAA